MNNIVRVTLDIRTDMDPGTLYRRIEDAIRQYCPTEYSRAQFGELVAGSAETVEPVPVVHPEGTEVEW